MKLEVIIPVGPGHEFLSVEAVRSVEMAALCGMGAFSEIEVTIVDDSEGELGRGAARNQAIRESRADWLFFLDADDLMYPTAMLDAGLLFSGYDAIWGQIVELHNGLMLERYQLPRIDSLDELLSVDPFYSLQAGFFVRREAMPLFDETMSCGEDWKVYLELWRSRRCLKQQGLVLMINRRGHHSTGPRSANGVEWRKAVETLIAEERKKLPNGNRVSLVPITGRE